MAGSAVSPVTTLDFLSKFNIPDLIFARLIPASDEQTFLPPLIVHRPTEGEKSDLPPPRKFFFSHHCVLTIVVNLLIARGVLDVTKARLIRLACD